MPFLLMALVAALAVSLWAAAPSGADQRFSAEFVRVGPGGNVWVVSNGSSELVFAGLLMVRLEDGTEGGAYCIQIHVPTTPGNRYVTEPWSSTMTGYGYSSVGPIRWILDHAPPTVAVADFAAQVGATLTSNQAHAATQLAIWHFADGIDPDPDRPLALEVQAAYDYLIAQATANAGYVAPDPFLELEEPSNAGRAGELIGPFTVRVGPSSTPVTASLRAGAPAGVRLVDSNGQPITGPVRDGQRLFLSVPAGTPTGSAWIDLSANVERRDLVLMPDDPAASQRLALASTLPATITAAGRGLWVAPADVADKPRDEQGGRDRSEARRARLSLNLRASRRRVDSGGTVRYVLRLRNVGNGAARDVELCERLPRGVSVVKRGGGRMRGGQICWRIPVLRPGSSVSRSLTLRIDSDARAGRLVSRAVARARGVRAVRGEQAVRVRPAPLRGVRDGLVTG